MQPKSERYSYQNESGLPLFYPNDSDRFGFEMTDFSGTEKNHELIDSIGVQFPDFKVEISLLDPFRTSVRGFVFQPETITVGVELL